MGEEARQISSLPLFLNVPEAAAILRCSPKFLYGKILKGEGPPTTRLGHGLRNALIRIYSPDFLIWARTTKETPNVQPDNRVAAKSRNVDVAIQGKRNERNGAHKSNRFPKRRAK